MPMKLLLAAALALQFCVTLRAAADDCVDADAVVGATYSIGGGAGDSPREFLLLRQSAGRLIYAMPDTHLMQVYERYPKGHVKLIEYFHLEAIGVEHEPEPSRPRQGWDAMYSLIAPATLAQLPVVGEGSYRCLATEQRQGLAGHDRVAVEWIGALDLPLTLQRGEAGAQKRWELQALVTDRAVLDAALARVEEYRLYDFADLGDSEHEEFFRRSRYLQYKLGHRH